MTTPDCDLVVVGAGAAGLAAAIFAGEAAAGALRILVIDGARKPGAKILVSGGGRCNVTHREVTPDDFFGGPRTIIRNVLRAFDHNRTLEWMNDLGVALKLEETGKYFPVSDSARTVLDALMQRLREVGAELHPSTRLTAFRPIEGGFELEVAERGTLTTRAVIFATGGLALPKSGSDGAGLGMLRALGHVIVPTTPALVPLLLGPGEGPAAHFADWSGLTLNARLRLAGANGAPIHQWTDSLLFTHFGISGPAALNISRHLLRARLENPDAGHQLLFGHDRFATPREADEWLLAQTAATPRRQVSTVLQELFPERLARALADNSETPLAQLPKAVRLDVARRISALPLHVTGDRGYTFAETTAGGVDLREIAPATMESRRVPGLFLCGELLDVDGRIGGFNFQWAWASGWLAGRAAVKRLLAG